VELGTKEKASTDVTDYIEPYRADNAKLVKEVNQLHLELIRRKDAADVRGATPCGEEDGREGGRGRRWRRCRPSQPATSPSYQSGCAACPTQMDAGYTVRLFAQTTPE